MASAHVPQPEAKLVLGAHLASAKHLIVAAAMVGDQDDFGVWIWRCKEWDERLGEALRYIYGSEAAHTFERATRAAGETQDWQRTLRRELERLHDATQMLSELSIDSAPSSYATPATSGEPSSLHGEREASERHQIRAAQLRGGGSYAQNCA